MPSASLVLLSYTVKVIDSLIELRSVRKSSSFDMSSKQHKTSSTYLSQDEGFIFAGMISSMRLVSKCSINMLLIAGDRLLPMGTPLDCL